MKMSEFQVGKRYRNPVLTGGAWVSLEEAGNYRIHLGEHDILGVPLQARVQSITRDDWEEVPIPWTETELRINRHGPETMWDYLVSRMRGGKFCDFEVTHKIKTADDLKDFMVRRRPLSDECRVALFDAIRPPPDPCDEAWGKASFGCVFPGVSMKEWTHSVNEAKEWFRRGYSAAMEAK